MRACAIVPQKSLAVAKSRLGRALPAGARATLSLTLLRAVCAALRATPEMETRILQRRQRALNIKRQLEILLGRPMDDVIN